MAESDASPPFLLATTTTIPSTHASSPNSLHPPTNVPPIPGQEKKGGGGGRGPPVLPNSPLVYNKAACTTPVIKLAPAEEEDGKKNLKNSTGGSVTMLQAPLWLEPAEDEARSTRAAIHNWCVRTITGLQTSAKCCTSVPQG